MFTNYFKLAIKVLGRHKFFTFISLFGISFTLMILMLVTAFLDSELGSHEPMTERNRMVFLEDVTKKKMMTDTILTIDSTKVGTQMEYDTTYEYRPYSNSTSIYAASATFLRDKLTGLDGVEDMAFYNSENSFDVFINNKKLNFGIAYTNANFWTVFDFTFSNGKPYQSKQVDNQGQVVVMSEKAAKEYFGKTEVVGELLPIEGKQFEVIGVIANSEAALRYFKSNLFIPYTNMDEKDLSNTDFQGPFEVAFLAKNKAGMETIKSALNKVANLTQLPNPEKFNTLVLQGTTYHENYAQDLAYNEDPKKSVRKVTLIIISMLLLFIILPTLNLINLNVSRIMERSSEIGVRKAFGASAGNILVQFVFENIILTLIGGIIGFVLAFVLINVINESNILEAIKLQFNFGVFIYSLIICLVFGVLSGIIPAYRMSKMQIVAALKRR